jgi:hypothetical protein
LKAIPRPALGTPNQQAGDRHAATMVRHHTRRNGHESLPGSVIVETSRVILMRSEMLPLEVSARDRNIGTSGLILRTPSQRPRHELPGQPFCRLLHPNPITVRFTTKIEPTNTACPMM